MHRRGSSSWRFEHDAGRGQFLNLALFVRDAADLPVPSSADIPPRLAGEIPDCSAVLSPDDRATAGDQWVVWWHQLLDQVVREARQRATLPPGDDGDPEARFQFVIRHLYAGRDDVFDPPQFAALAGMRPLQSAAVGTFEQAGQWTRRDPSGGQRPGAFPADAVREIAESTAADLGVPVHELDGVAHVLDVTGVWSYLAGPGCGLCSEAVATDAAAARQLLRQLFSSGPGREAALSP
jgi:hypothetical protein